MNRSLTNVLFGGIGTSTAVETHKIEGSITQTTVEDTVDALANADSVILVRMHFFSVACFLYFTGGWLWYGSRKSTVCHIGNYSNASQKRNQGSGKLFNIYCLSINT